MHLPPRILDRATGQSEDLAQYIAILQTHGFVGVEKQKMYQAVKDFLWTQEVPFMSNKRGMIWLQSCEDYLMAIFMLEE